MSRKNKKYLKKWQSKKNRKEGDGEKRSKSKLKDAKKNLEGTEIKKQPAARKEKGREKDK